MKAHSPNGKTVPKKHGKAGKGATPVGVRSSTRTGTTPHFERWKAEGKIKSILQRTKTAQLADSIGDDDRAASGFALLYLAGFKNVWDVSQASRTDLLRAKGVGHVTLGHVEDYLKARNVALAWSVN